MESAEIAIGKYEVLPGEGFSHITEPTLSFSQRSIWVNTGCLKRMPDTVCVHFLLFRPEKSMIIKPCTEGDRDAVRWRTPSGKPRIILCDAGFRIDITTLMGWNDHDRYRLLGNYIRSSEWNGLAFDMTRAVVFPRMKPDHEPHRPLHMEAAVYPTWEEHCRKPLVKRFAEDTLLVIDEEGQNGETVFTPPGDPD